MSSLYIPLGILVWVSPFIAGLFYEWSFCLASLYLLIVLIWSQAKNRKLIIRSKWLFFSTIMLTVMLAASPLWAVDRGMSLLGVFRFLPLLLFVVGADQLTRGEKERILQKLPLCGVLMVILSMTGYGARLLPGSAAADLLKEFFLVNDRLAGFFQYPNTFALFLLLCLAVMLFDSRAEAEEAERGTDFLRLAELVLLSAGIILSGSRSVFVLWLLVLAAGLVKNSGQVLGRRYILAAGVIIIAVLILVFVSGNRSNLGRFLTISLRSSTFLGRLLYDRDALSVLWKHPLGLGYLGYYYSEGAFQTGVYSVRHVHNDLLQLILDAGFVSAALCLAALFITLKKKWSSGEKGRCIIILLCVIHSLFDFDLQFLAVDFLLLLCMAEEDAHSPEDGGRRKKPDIVLKRNPAFMSVFILLAGASLYFLAATALYAMRQPKAACTLYPAYTEALKDGLVNAGTVEEMDSLADRILKQNPDHPLANSAKARVKYSQGNFEEMIRYKERAISYAKYDLKEYLDYFDMLATGCRLYEEAGDTQSALYCLERIKKIPEMLDEVKRNTSWLGWQIRDLPELDLPEEYQKMLQEAEYKYSLL